MCHYYYLLFHYHDILYCIDGETDREVYTCIVCMQRAIMYDASFKADDRTVSSQTENP